MARVRGSNEFESLDRRLLFAASAAAPHTVAALVIDFKVVATSGIYDSNDDFELRFGLSDPSFEVVSTGTGEGTYTFARPSASVAKISTTNSANGNFDIITLSFTSLTSGTYGVESPGLVGSQSGAFKIVDTIAPLAVKSGNTIAIQGTGFDDVVTVSKVKNKLYVTQNNWTTSFSAAPITKLTATLGKGNDTLRLGAGVPGIYCDSGEGNDSLLGGDGKDTLTAGSGKDTLDGGANDDRLNGGGNNDSILGGAGNDRLYGGDGNDILIGGGNVDRIYAGAGNDVLVGGASNDKLFGEAGNDTLTGNAGADLLDGGIGTDKAKSDSGDTRIGIEG